MKIAFYGLVLAFCLPAAAQFASFHSLDGAVLKALVFHPPTSSNRQANQASRGTVIALHGCGGLYATTGLRKGQRNARHQAMANLLVAEVRLRKDLPNGVNPGQGVHVGPNPVAREQA